MIMKITIENADIKTKFAIQEQLFLRGYKWYDLGHIVLENICHLIVDTDSKLLRTFQTFQNAQECIKTIQLFNKTFYIGTNHVDSILAALPDNHISEDNVIVHSDAGTYTLRAIKD